MKIAIGSMMHESNTFTCLRTELADFTIAEGWDFKSVARWKGSVTDGIFDALEQAGAEVVPVYFARTLPSGTVTRAAYEHMRDQLVRGIADIPDLDGICLALHGSMSVAGVDDPEGELLAAIRAEIGIRLPIVCALDMHATLTQTMIQNSNGFYAYRTAPHEDEYETGNRAAEILLRSIGEGREIVTALAKIPFLISGEQSETAVEPAKSLFDSLAEQDKRAGVLYTSYVMGFPWADCIYGGAGALVCGYRESIADLCEIASEMAAAFWARRMDFSFSTPAATPAEALAFAREAGAYPVILSDTGDNPTAGATQDTTQLLRLMLDTGVKRGLFAAIADAEAYRICATQPVGARFSLAFGGAHPETRSQRMTAEVVLLSRAVHDGLCYAAVALDGVTVILADQRCEVYDPDVLAALGLAITDFAVVVLKTGYLSPAYKALAGRSLFALTDGDTGLLLENLPYARTPRPIFPLDVQMQYTPTVITAE